MKFLHTADVHLKDMSHLETLRVLAKTANANGCAGMLVCGDLFDENSSIRLTEPGLAETLEIFNGQIFVLPGNHDAKVLAERKSLSKNSTVLNSTELVIRKPMDGFEIVAVPYKEGYCLKDAGDIDCDPMKSILMAHGSYYSTDFFYEGAKDYFPMFEEDLKDKFRYAALGHYHKVVRLNLGGTTAVNPGSPRPTRDSDTGKRMVSIIDTDTWKSELLELDVPYYEKAVVNLNYSDTPETISAKVASSLPQGSGRLEKLFIEYRGTLSDRIRVEELKELTGRWIRENRKGKPDLNAMIDTTSLKLIDGELLKNPFIASLMEEIAKQDAAPEEKERLKLFTIERINTLF